MKKSKTGFVTQQSIADAVGVSRETVAQILGGKEGHRYSEETQQRVRKTAEALGYRPSRAAQIMRKRRSNLIGVLHFGSGHYLAHQSTQLLPQCLHARGFDPLVMDLSWLGGCYRRAVEQLIEARAEGVIIAYAGESFHREEVEMLRNAGIPLVALAGNQWKEVPVVLGDSTDAFRKIVGHLAGLGHERLLYLGKDIQNAAPRNRLLGFKYGLEDFPHLEGRIGLLPNDTDILDSERTPYEFALELFAKGEIPDAIVCSNDQFARGVISAASEVGLRAPQDFAITGFDNEPFSARSPYFLTTASVDIAAQCRLAVKLLLDLISGKELRQCEHVFPSELIIRRSCGSMAKAS